MIVGKRINDGKFYSNTYKTMLVLPLMKAAADQQPIAFVVIVAKQLPSPFLPFLPFLC